MYIKYTVLSKYYVIYFKIKIDEGFRQILKRNFAEFCQTVDADQLSHLLYENNILAPSELRQMQFEISTIARNKIILFSVLDKDIKIFYTLIGILKRHGSDCERDLAWKLDQEVAHFQET